MSSKEDLDVDDDFSDLYKAYTGPLGCNAPNAQDKAATSEANKRSHAGTDEEDDAHDLNAVPTDFTSREAKVWVAKSKATERNWKKRKEEEMICKICGESGHFTQGCPSTLGSNRKSQDFFERVPAREPHVKALFSEDAVNKIEKDIGCKIKIEEKFIIVSGKDRLILKRGVDAVHKIKEEGENKGAGKFLEDEERKGSSSSPNLRSRSLERRSPVTSRLGRSDSQKSNHSPYNTVHNTHRYARQDKAVEDRVRDDLKRLPDGSPQARAYGNDGGRGQSSHSKSPAHLAYKRNSYNSYEDHSQTRGGFRTGGWNTDRGDSNLQLVHNLDYPSVPRTLEGLEFQYEREAMELEKIHNKEEDLENHKHREITREMRESYRKKVTILTSTHAKMWEEFLQRESQRRLQARSHFSASGFGGYKQSSYPESDHSPGNLHRSGANINSRGRYPSAMEGYPSSRSHDTFDDFQRPRRDDFSNPYNRY